MVDINQFEKEITCTYRDETYNVRDNGAVFRFPRNNHRKRPNDNLWTFGKPNYLKGYMEIASERIHRIVAIAFHGEPPTKDHVVDHIDTNKRNNRPENLRWVTRLENVLLNPITIKRIESACGCNVEEFLADPSKFRDMFQEPNYEWMCTVSIQEAQSSKERLLAWAESDKHLSGGSLGEWIFTRNNMSRESTKPQKITESRIPYLALDEIVKNVFAKIELETGLTRSELSSKSKNHKLYNARIQAAKLLRSEIGLSDEGIGNLIGRSPSMVNSYLHASDFIYRGYPENNHLTYSQIQLSESELSNSKTTESLTPNAVQKNWKTPCEFPFCPQTSTLNPIIIYAKSLTAGQTFSRNQYFASIVEDLATSKDGNTLWVMCKSN
jgi:hypothetical protein